MGDFVVQFLAREGVDTSYVSRKPGRRTSAVILGIEPPDRFPLVYYRDNCADNALDIEDVLSAPIARSRAFEFAGTNLSAESSRSATLFAAEVARRADVPVILDIDFRPDQWHDPRAFGVALRSALPLTDVVIGTQDEIKAAVLSDTSQVSLTHQQVSDARVSGDLQAAIATLLSFGAEVLVEKCGAEGARIHRRDGSCEDAPGYPVDIYNILGAGDAFASGFIYGVRERVAAAKGGEAGKRLRRHCGDPARMCEFHAYHGGSAYLCRAERRTVGQIPGNYGDRTHDDGASPSSPISSGRSLNATVTSARFLAGASASSGTGMSRESARRCRSTWIFAITSRATNRRWFTQRPPMPR